MRWVHITPEVRCNDIIGTSILSEYHRIMDKVLFLQNRSPVYVRAAQSNIQS